VNLKSAGKISVSIILGKLKTKLAELEEESHLQLTSNIMIYILMNCKSISSKLLQQSM